MRYQFPRRILTILAMLAILAPLAASAQISGIRITQTGNTGLMINVDVTAFWTTGTTTTQAYLGTYYNQVPAIDWGDGATTPRYGYGPSTGIPLVATSTVVNGIPARAYRGSFSHTYGSGGNYTMTANTNCCPVTTPTYTLVTGTIQSTTITTTGPFGPTTFTTSFVQNTLAVAANPPGFSKAFAPTDVGPGTPSTLTFTIDNTANTMDPNALDFTDNLPGGLTVAATPNVVNTCTGGTVTAVAGSGTISYTGGSVTAGATCTISVDVSAAAIGAYANTTGDLTSAFGNSGTASDTLNVAGLPSFSKAFFPTAISSGDVTTLTFTIDNSASGTALTMMSFTDNMPTGMEVAAPNNLVNGCGGTVTAVAGTSVVSLAGGTVAAASVCNISLDVLVNSGDASLTNSTGALTTNLGTGPAGEATDTVTLGFPIPTASEVGLVVLSLLLAMMALFVMRRRQTVDNH